MSTGGQEKKKTDKDDLFNARDIEEEVNPNEDRSLVIPKAQKEEDDGSTLSPGEKSRLLFACLCALCVGNMMMLNVASFLPIFCEDHAWIPDTDHLDTQDIAFIISVFSIAQIIFAPFNANIKSCLGAKWCVLFGFFLLTTTTFGLGLISRI